MARRPPRLTTPAAVIYCRVSTEEQGDSGLGLEAQARTCRVEAERRGWAVAAVVTDVASGRSLAHRPGLADALRSLAAGRATVLVTAKLDRLSRSVRDFADLLAQAERERWHLVALDAPADTTSPQGEALAHMLAVFSQLERRLIGQRTREALAAKRARGDRLGGPVELDPAVEDRIVARRRGGATLAAIVRELTAAGVPTPRGGAWRPSTLQRVCARQDVPRFPRGPRAAAP